MIIVKTEAGHRVMKDRSVFLTPRQRSAFILLDGKRSLDQVLAATAAVGVTRQDIDHLLELGLVMDASPAWIAAKGADTPAFAEAVKQNQQRTHQERYLRAYPLAAQLTASLGLRGFRLNLAVEASGSYEALRKIAPRIREAVGADRFVPLENALNGY